MKCKHTSVTIIRSYIIKQLPRQKPLLYPSYILIEPKRLPYYNIICDPRPLHLTNKPLRPSSIPTWWQRWSTYPDKGKKLQCKPSRSSLLRQSQRFQDTRLWLEKFPIKKQYRKDHGEYGRLPYQQQCPCRPKNKGKDIAEAESAFVYTWKYSTADRALRIIVRAGARFEKSIH